MDGLQVFVRPETQAMTQIEAGAMDFSRITNVSDIVRLKADPNYQVIVHPNPGADLEMGYNASQPPFDNKLMRQAFNYATNRQRLVELYQGTTEAITLPWSKSSPAYDAAKNKAYAFDLDKARALIQQAGVSTPFEHEVLIQAGLPILESFMQVFQQDLSKIGVNLTITRQESGPFFTNLLGKTFFLRIREQQRLQHVAWHADESVQSVEGELRLLQSTLDRAQGCAGDGDGPGQTQAAVRHSQRLHPGRMLGATSGLQPDHVSGAQRRARTRALDALLVRVHRRVARLMASRRKSSTWWWLAPGAPPSPPQ